MRFIKDSRMLLFIALPLLFSRLVDMAVFFVGFIYISKLGHMEFAASALASSVYVTSIVVAMGILYAMGIKMSQAFGAKNYAQIREYFYSALILAAVLSALVIGIISIISSLLPYLGQNPDLIPSAKTFLFAFCIPLFPTLVTVVVNQLVSVLLKPRIVFFTSLINAAVTIACFYPLIFGAFGHSGLGSIGFGLALAIGNLVLIAITLGYVRVEKYFNEFELFKFKGVAQHVVTRMMEIVRLGLPMGIQFGAEIAAFSVITFMIGRFGVSSLIGAQVAQQIVVFVLCIPFTMSEATAILVGQSMGHRDRDAMRSYGFSSLKLVGIFLLATSVIFLEFPRALAGIYLDLNDPAMESAVNLTISFLYVAAFGQIFDGLRNTISGALRGLNDSMYPMYTGIFIVWCIGLPIGILLSQQDGIGPIGFQIGSAVAFLVGAIILVVRFNKKTKNDSLLASTEMEEIGTPAESL